ncbi:hypothetical protein [Vibrio coralliirubri]|uniref:hypothetical protein n=1 Tax=Vibrio coralliirubri TaxID=1516159 RepID=UPI00062EC91B|nr:hypothetical protein [Vibrio coralliirubri]CDT39121.1 conserved membrane hypothetical protein [Vibrio coralliirubri]CDT79211.1 conserved membrane hypothetical protein [Vibrio coralliirubri]
MLWNLNLPSTGPHLFLALGATIIFVVDYHVPLGIAMAVPYVTIVLLAATTKDPTSTVMWAITCTLLTLIGYYLSNTGSETWFVAFNRVITIYAIWISAIVPIYVSLKPPQAPTDDDKDALTEEKASPRSLLTRNHTINTFKN